MSDTDVPEIELSAAGLPVRTCARCGLTDDHPRCLPYRPDDPSFNVHPDCHQLMVGPADCHQHLETADGKTGDELRAHIVNGAGA